MKRQSSERVALPNRYRDSFPDFTFNGLFFSFFASDLPTTNNSIQRINLKVIRVMARSTFKVLFYVKRQSEKSGQVPVMGRITINGTIS